MTAFNRFHHKDIADALREMKDHGLPDVYHAMVVNRFVAIFEKDNTRFNAGRFRKAAGCAKEDHSGTE